MLRGQSSSNAFIVARCRFPLPPGARLDLDVDAEAELGAERERFLERRHRLTAKRALEPRPGVEAPDRGKRGRRHQALSVGGPLQAIVVKEDRMAVLGQLDVELDPRRAERFRLGDAGQRVLRRCGGGAAVADHARQGERRGILGLEPCARAAVDRHRIQRVHW